MTGTPAAVAEFPSLKLRKCYAWRGIRVLAWHGNILYGCSGYQVVSLDIGRQTGETAEWKEVARFRPTWLRNLTSRSALSYRLMRDGFHALAILGASTEDPRKDPTKDSTNELTMVGAVPGAIVTGTVGSD